MPNKKLYADAGGRIFSLTRLVGLLGLVLVAALQYGCAYTRPYVDPYAPLPAANDGKRKALPTIPAAVRTALPNTLVSRLSVAEGRSALPVPLRRFVANAKLSSTSSEHS